MPFYFGCEADDPSNVWAFNARANPLGARLNAIFSSDIGHFDVPDMTEVVPEAYEMGRGRAGDRGRFPRLHVRQRRAPQSTSGSRWTPREYQGSTGQGRSCWLSGCQALDDHHTFAADTKATLREAAAFGLLRSAEEQVHEPTKPRPRRVRSRSRRQAAVMEAEAAFA
jgi:hypothetical protein